MATTFRVVPDETKCMVGHRVVNVKVNNLVKKGLYYIQQNPDFLNLAREMEIGLENQKT